MFHPLFGAELRQLIDGKLIKQEQEPRNVQVVIHKRFNRDVSFSS